MWLNPVWHISVWSHFCGLIYVYIRRLNRVETLAGWFPSLCNHICPWAAERMFWVFAGQQNKTIQHHRVMSLNRFVWQHLGDVMKAD